MLLAIAAVASSSQNSTSTLSQVEPGVLGFLVVAALSVALVFLLKSMNKQLRKIGPKPEEDLLSLGDLAADGGPAAVAGEVISRADAGPAVEAKPLAGA
jgi:hypothetical protein